MSTEQLLQKLNYLQVVQIKNLMLLLVKWKKIMTIRSAVLIQYQRVTDGQTNGQTDVQPISITCFSIANARKK